MLRLVEVMHRLRSPGGCPWDAEQTHESLATYLLEETYETLEAIDSGDSDHLREELGDLLLQVVFHARIAQETPNEGWTIDDVAADISDKLVRRHPHVFGEAQAETAAHVEAAWDALKAAEKQRTSALDGVPLALPALSLATKVLGRAERAGVAPTLAEPASVVPDDEQGVGDTLLVLVHRARSIGVDPEQALRRAVGRYADQVRGLERDQAGERAGERVGDSAGEGSA
jgi:XTP/dITP diphosphohydrolase